MPFSFFNLLKRERRREASSGSTQHQPAAPPGAPTRRDIAEHLRSVLDPEVGLNIVDLGLIYDLQVEEGTVTVRLTMTTPACPLSNYIKQQVGRVLQRVPGVEEGTVELTWDPPWSPQMIDPDVSLRRFGGRYRAE